jgi:hypothetical protein
VRADSRVASVHGRHDHGCGGRPLSPCRHPALWHGWTTASTTGWTLYAPMASCPEQDFSNSLFVRLLTVAVWVPPLVRGPSRAATLTFRPFLKRPYGTPSGADVTNGPDG